MTIQSDHFYGPEIYLILQIRNVLYNLMFLMVQMTKA